MDQKLDLRSWYDEGRIQGTSIAFVDDAFQAASKRFASASSGTKGSAEFLASAASLKDVQEELAKSLQKYHSERKHPRARKWLHKAMSGLHYYGNILDALAQHHPEYVALAWGAMKFLIQGVINHENVVEFLAKALSRIARSLPRVELAGVLFPTDRMQRAIEELFGHLLRFFVRAYDWYQENSLMHIVHSITRPAELRYAEIYEDIVESSRNIDQIAVSSSQVELRQIHAKMNDMLARFQSSETMLTDIRAQMIAFQAINSSALLDTNRRISDLQFSQIMFMLSNVPYQDPAELYRYHLMLRNQRGSQRLGDFRDFWRSPRLHQWSSSKTSDLIVIYGNFQVRQLVRDFSVGVMEQLRRAGAPAIWAMMGFGELSQPTKLSTVDLIKYLTLQALRLHKAESTEKDLALSCARFHSARTETEWFQVLEGVLGDFGRQVFLVVDLEILDSGSMAHFDWSSAFLDFFGRLVERGSGTVVKVMLLKYSPGMLPQSEMISDSTISINGVGRKTPWVSTSMRRRFTTRKELPLPFIN